MVVSRASVLHLICKCIPLRLFLPLLWASGKNSHEENLLGQYRELFRV